MNKHTTMTKHKFNIYPEARDEDYAGLVDSIRHNGFDPKFPIVVYQGEILDGWNRWRACEELDIKPVLTTFTGSDMEAFDFMRLTNNRRNLTSSQRACVAIEAGPILEAIQTAVAADRVEKQKANAANQYSEPSDKKLSQATKDHHATSAPTKIATAFDTNRSYINQAAKLKDANPEAFEAVKDGTLTLSEVKKKEQLAQRHHNITEKTKAEVQAVPPTIEFCDCIEWLNRQETADLLITDPPYSTDVEDINAFAAEWLPLALAKVKSTGRAYVCVGAYPEELAAYLKVAMPTQILVWTYRNTLGPSPSHGYKLNWQAILYYQMPDAPPLDCPIMLEQFSVQDINAPDGRLGDRYHAWQKPMQLAERLIRHSTKDGDSVIDPFACTGTFLLAASSLGRLAKGCEIDDSNLGIAINRGCVHAQ